MLINWVPPYDGGSEISRYEILIRAVDGTTFLPELTHCDGSNAVIMSATECTIPTSVLRSIPFDLKWGDSIQVQIVATNIKGNSLTSVAGNGAIILRVPDAPLNLQNVAGVTDGEQIGIEW